MKERKQFFDRPYIIPSLKDPLAFQAWATRIAETITLFEGRGLIAEWSRSGAASLKTELGEYLYQDVLWFAGNLIINHNGRLKLTSIGGGELRGMLDLRELALAIAKDAKIENPRVTIDDFSLTKKMASKGLKYWREEELLKSGEVRLHAAPFEVADTADAENSDIIIALRSALSKAQDRQHTIEMAEKAAELLAPGGLAVLETGETVMPALKQKFEGRFEVKFATPGVMEFVRR